MGERLEYIDVAKAIGIITVLCVHAGMGIIWVQPYYMPMFFAASGCVFTFLCKRLDYCLESAVKIVKIYFKNSIIVAVMYIPLIFIKHKDYTFVIRNLIGIFYARKALYSPLDLENNVIFMEYGNGPMWFLPCLAIAWLLFIPLNALRSRKVALLGCIFLYLLLSEKLSKLLIMLPWSLDTAFVAAIFLCIGTQYEDIRKKYLLNLKGGGYKLIQLIPIYGLCNVVYLILVNQISINWNMSVGAYDTSISSGVFFFCMFCMLGTVMMFTFCCLLEKSPMASVLSMIGRNSLPLLCFHAVIYQYIEVINNKFELSLYPGYRFVKICITMIGCILWEKSVSIVKNKLIRHINLFREQDDGTRA